MWRIVNWNEHFENNRSREVKDCKWVAMPNSHDGAGYTELLEHKNGPAHFGAWCAIVQVASKSKPRGELRRGGRQLHDVKSLSRITRIPPSILEEAIPRMIRLGWLEEITEGVEAEQDAGGRQEGATKSQDPALNGREGMEGKEGNGMEGEGTETPAAAALFLPEILDHPSFRNQLAAWLRYKGKNAYKPDGLTAMISRAANRAAEFGLPTVVAAIQTAMANGWKGWDQDSSFKHRSGAKADPRGNLAAYQQFAKEQEEVDG